MSALDFESVLTVKGVVAAAATLLLCAGIALRRAGRPETLRRTRDALLLALGLLGAACWWNLFQFHYPDYLHVHESYHYYVGPKYFRELGYTRIYECSVLADVEDGVPGALEGRRVRDLESNVLRAASRVVQEPERCKAHFTPERWAAFKRDIAWYRSQFPTWQWRRMQMDHGYNATPAWGILGTLLTNAGSGPGEDLLWLALADNLLLAALWAAVVWAFGWRTACVALVFWGTNYFASFDWVGGGVLRQDWLLALVLGICALRRGHPVAAGFALTASTLLRIFPGVVVAVVALAAARGLWERRSLRPTPLQLRFAAGCALALATLLPLSAATSGGFGAWAEFAGNSRKHVGTPLENHVGLASLLSYAHTKRAAVLRAPQAEDPYLAWKLARRAVFEERRPLYLLLAAGYAILLWRALRGQPEWVAAALGLGAIPIATELSCYYLTALTGMALLRVRRAGAGVALCALAVASWPLALAFDEPDELFVWTSAAIVAAVFAVTALFAGGGGQASATLGPAPAKETP